MTDETRLRDRMRAIAESNGPPEPFDDVLAARAPRRQRIRPARALIAATALLAGGFLALDLRQGPAPQLAELALPTTTDWLLETPPPDWLARASLQSNNHGEEDAH